MYSTGLTAENYLRGVQIADDAGVVTFTSIFPGCYAGRWPHIHFQVFPDQASITSATAAIATSQVALPKDVCDAVYAIAGYDNSAGNLSRLYAEFPHVITEDFDFEPTSGWLLGYDARAALVRHSSRFQHVVHRLLSIVDRELSPERASPLIAQLNPIRTDQAIKLLSAFRAGLSGAVRP